MSEQYCGSNCGAGGDKYSINGCANGQQGNTDLYMTASQKTGSDFDQSYHSPLENLESKPTEDGLGADISFDVNVGKNYLGQKEQSEGVDVYSMHLKTQNEDEESDGLESSLTLGNEAQDNDEEIKPQTEISVTVDGDDLEQKAQHKPTGGGRFGINDGTKWKSEHVPVWKQK